MKSNNKPIMYRLIYKFIFIFIFICNFLIFEVKANENTCSSFLYQVYHLPTDLWPSAKDYSKLNEDFRSIENNPSVANLVSLFKSFVSGYHERYSLHVEELVRTFPDLNDDHLALRKSLVEFLNHEKAIQDLIKNKISNLPAKKRMQYLRRLDFKKLLQIEVLLDSLLGLGDMSDGIKMTPWPRIVEEIESLELRNEDVFVDLGSENIRLGLLIGLYFPNNYFYCLESSKGISKSLSELNRKNGFTNVKCIHTDLSDPLFNLPQADHYFISESIGTDPQNVVFQKLSSFRKTH